MDTDVARAVEEGLLIGRSTVTLATKNHLIVGALREGRSLHDLDLDGFVADQLRQMSVEQNGYAARTARSARTARTAVGALRHQHDYRPADVRVLEERALIYSELARAFADLAADAAVAAELAEAARVDAWSELSSVIGKRLDLIARAADDPSYEGSRRESMAAVREVDLPTLEPDYRRWS
ncbi:hypothetical protein [Conyzicola nivalis]|uniref:hypothetical protein n=1 Tax=Conyzicola nivalis TaxID=1477021 RepID=UPI00166E0731|nr:hypothetical protein [Conyzicola nivalis]